MCFNYQINLSLSDPEVVTVIYLHNSHKFFLVSSVDLVYVLPMWFRGWQQRLKVTIRLLIKPPDISTNVPNLSLLKRTSNESNFPLGFFYIHFCDTD